MWSLFFGFRSLLLIDFTKIFQLRGLKPKNKGHENFYECCNLTKKVYLLSLSFGFRTDSFEIFVQILVKLKKMKISDLSNTYDLHGLFC